MNECLSSGNQAFCTCALTALENEFTADEYAVFEQEFKAQDPSAQAKLQQVIAGCRSQVPSG